MKNNTRNTSNLLLPEWITDIDIFDGLEVHPVKTEWYKGGTYCEQCEPHEAEFWSVYGHCKEGGVLCIDDFVDEKSAVDYANKLLDAYPHLHEFGLLGG